MELAAHCHGAETLYMAIEGRVYDITHYVNKHPGGVLMMTRNAGLDVTAVFNRVGHSARARAMLADMYVGDLVVTGQIDPTGALLIALWLACRLLVAVPATGSEQTRARAWKQARASVGCCVRGRERACVEFCRDEGTLGNERNRTILFRRDRCRAIAQIDIGRKVRINLWHQHMNIS